MYKRQDITIDGSTISDAADLTLDVGGDIILDADGGQVRFSDGGSAIGEIQQVANDLTIYSTASGHNGLRFHANGILPTDNAGAIVNNDADLGDPSYRFKDLYLAGTAYSNSFETAAGGTFTTASGNDLNIVYPDTRSLFIKEAGTTHVTVDNLGRVGINRTPAVANSKLEVGGADNVPLINVEASGNTAGFGIGSGNLSFFNGTSAVGTIALSTGTLQMTAGAVSSPTYSFVGDTDTGMSRPTSNAINFVCGGSEKMRINSGGQILMGITSAHDGNFRLGGIATTTVSFLSTQNNVTSATCVVASFRSNNNSEVGSIKTSDSVTAFNTSSDYRLKENVRPLKDGLSRVSKIKPVKFDWISDGTSTEGFIAHELQEVFPDAVDGEKDGENMQGVDYGKITPLLVKAIQEQQTIIEDLKARIEKLES